MIKIRKYKIVIITTIVFVIKRKGYLIKLLISRTILYCKASSIEVWYNVSSWTDFGHFSILQELLASKFCKLVITFHGSLSRRAQLGLSVDIPNSFGLIQPLS
jgi:hypothetical protein